MRNKLYGRGFAVYVTPDETEGVKSKKIVALPDTTFGKRKIKIQPVLERTKAEKHPDRIPSAKKAPELELLSVQRPQFSTI